MRGMRIRSTPTGATRLQAARSLPSGHMSGMYVHWVAGLVIGCSVSYGGGKGSPLFGKCDKPKKCPSSCGHRRPSPRRLRACPPENPAARRRHRPRRACRGTATRQGLADDDLERTRPRCPRHLCRGVSRDHLPGRLRARPTRSPRRPAHRVTHRVTPAASLPQYRVFGPKAPKSNPLGLFNLIGLRPCEATVAKRSATSRAI